MNHFHVPGLSVTRAEEGALAWTRDFGTLEAGADRPVTGGSIFHACSISKMITALTVLRLAQDGVLDLHANINSLLTSWQMPENEFTAKRPVTLANLLAHQAGLRDAEGTFGPVADGEPGPSTLDLLTGATAYNPVPPSPQYVPETDWEYSDAGYCVVAQVVQDVTGVSVIDVARRLVLAPLGLSNTFFWAAGDAVPDGIDMAVVAVGHGNHGEIIDQPRAAYPNPEGAGLWSSTPDLARVALDVIASYRDGSGVVLSKEMARFMFTGFGCAPDQGMAVFLDSDADGRPFFFSQGWGVGAQCKLRGYYTNGSVVVVMTNSEPGMEQDESVVGEVIAAVCAGEPLE